MPIAAFTGLCEGWGPGRGSVRDCCGRTTMRRYLCLATLFVGVCTLTLVAVGCRRGGDVEEAATQSATEALGVKGTGTERTIESQRHVIVQDTKKVVDADTGQVLKTEETKTPVTITEQKTIERKVDVNSGEMKKKIK